jgi:hypothetical protein
METIDCLPSTPTVAPAKPRRNKRQIRPQLLTRDQLDGRTNAAKTFDRIVSAIEADLGGADQLSTIERCHIEGFAGAYVCMLNLNTRLALGEDVDLSQHAVCLSEMVRATRVLGPSRRAKPITDFYKERLPQLAAQHEPAAGL